MNKLISALFAVGAVMTLAGAVTFMSGWLYAPYVYTIGATLFALAQINTFYRGENKNLRRLYRQQLLGAFFLVLAGALMFFSDQNEWILMLTVGAIMELYSSFRISHEEKKEAKRDEEEGSGKID